MTGGPRVTALRRYPVKACAPEHLEAASVGVDGFLHDRHLAVAVGDAIVTQREFALLARVRPSLDDATGLLRLAYDGRDAVEAVVETDRPTREVTDLPGPRRRRGPGPGALRLVQRPAGSPGPPGGGAPSTTRRASPGLVQGQTVLSDEGTVSLHSEASLAELNHALAARGHGSAHLRPVPREHRHRRSRAARGGRRTPRRGR